MTTCNLYKCQREEQCDDCWLVDHCKECSGCDYVDHPKNINTELREKRIERQQRLIGLVLVGVIYLALIVAIINY